MRRVEKSKAKESLAHERPYEIEGGGTPQTFQNPLIKEYTLMHIRDRIINYVRYIP